MKKAIFFLLVLFFYYSVTAAQVEEVEHYVDDFVRRLQDVATVNITQRKLDFGPGIEKLYDEFQAIYPEVSDSTWQTVAQKRQLSKWPHQDWHSAVGGALFLEVALGCHRTLIRDSLMPLTHVSANNWGDAWQLARTQLSSLIEQHSFMRRRIGLFALTAARHFGNHLAEFVLLEGLQQVSSKQNAIVDQEKKTRDMRVFATFDQHLKDIFFENKAHLAALIDDRPYAQLDVREGSRTKRRTLESLQVADERNCPCVVLAQQQVFERLDTLSNDEANKAFSQFVQAGEGGAPEGFYLAAELLRRASFHNNIQMRVPYKQDVLFVYAACTGYLDAFSCLESQLWDKFYKYRFLFEQIRKFLHHPHHKPKGRIVGQRDDRASASPEKKVRCK